MVAPVKVVRTDGWPYIAVQVKFPQNFPDYTTLYFTEFRIRKNLKDLSDEEFHDLLQAMTKFKKDKTKRGYKVSETDGIFQALTPRHT